MADTTHQHPHDHHDWDSSQYVSNWASGQDKKEMARQKPFRVMARTIPYDKNLPIRILDVGAGYGAVTQFLLSYFPNATAVCQDGSEEMTKLGRERMKDFKGRFNYVLCDFSKAGWSKKLAGPFEARADLRDPAAIDDDVRLFDAAHGHDGATTDDHCFASSSRKRPRTSIATATSSVVADSAGL